MSDLNIQSFKYDLHNDTSVKDEKILKPCEYLNQLLGKKKRKTLLTVVNLCFDIPKDKLSLCQQTMDTFYTSGVIWDDIKNQSVLRKEFPATHLIYGVRWAYNAARYSTLLEMANLRNFNTPEVSEMVVRYMLESFRGTAKDIFWKDNCVCPSLEEYKLMAYQKTCLAVLVAKLLQSYSETKTDLTNLAKIVALAVQIKNDYDNLNWDKCTEETTFGEAISEGKFTFPIVHAIQTKPNDKQIIDILKQKTKDMETLQSCLSLLKEFGSIDYTYNVLMGMRGEMVKELKVLPEGETLIQFLEMGFVVEMY